MARAPGAPGGSPSAALPPSLGLSAIPMGTGAVADGPVLLNLSASPSTICSYDAETCAANTTTVRVTLSASVVPATTWGNASDVQVLFVQDLTPFSYGCSLSSGCGISYPFTHTSNSLYYFRQNATHLTTALQAANPGLNLTFGLVETSGTNGSLGDGDEWSYRVDVGGFVNATSFGTAVNGSAAPADLDYSDISLDSASISAFYAALNGVGVNWTAGDGHVLVYLGASAPEAPGYSEDWCALYGVIGTAGCDTPTCEPAANFSSISMPACEGWTSSTTSNTSASLVGAANGGTPTCRNAFGGTCRIDVIDLNATPTDPYSPDWKNATGLVNGSDVWNNTHRVLDAGCALANATNGSWDGPTWYTCGSTTGTLDFNSSLSSTNPTFAAAVASVRLAPSDALTNSSYLDGTDRPLFQFVPARNVSLAPTLNASVSCRTVSGAFAGCAATAIPIDNGAGIGWNWSTDPGTNRLHANDSWSASFDVIVTSPPGTVPLDACTSAACLLAEGSSTFGNSGTTYRLDGSGPARFASFPLATVTAEAPNPLAAQISATPAELEPSLTANITVTADGGVAPYSFLWQVPPDGSSVVVGPTDAFVASTPGIAYFAVEVVDALGHTTNVSTVIVVLSPVTVLTSAVPVSPGVGTNRSLSGTAPLSVAFQAQALDGLPPFAYAWSSGDGQSAATATVDFTYATPGSYTATLTVTDALGMTTTATFTVTAVAASAAPASLAVSALATPGSAGCGGTEYTLTASATGGTAPYTFSWTLGDGATGTGPTVSHFYAGGHYSAAVTVTDATGRTTTALVSVEAPSLVCAASPPPPAFSLLDGTIVGGAVAAALVAAVVGALLVRRRRRGPTRGSRPS